MLCGRVASTTSNRGQRCGKIRIARLMREGGLRPMQMRRFRPRTTEEAEGSSGRCTNHFADPALGHFEDFLNVCERFSSARRAYDFPSLRIALSKDRSATSRLSRPFSFSSSLSRLTVSVFAPPNSCRHRW